jgi:tetrapyrrole methylase family protein / MazG family protein
VPSARPHITVVGLGPAGPDLVTQAAVSLLAAAGESGRAILRTARHPAAVLFAGLPTFDDRYESAATFEEVYAGIVETLVAAAEAEAPEPIVYAVPGSPLVAERTVELLRGESRVDIMVVPATSFLDLAWSALGVDPLAAGVRLVDAEAFGGVARDGRGPFLVAQCWSRHLLSEVKLALGEVVESFESAGAPEPSSVQAVVLHHLGLADEVVRTVEWWQLDRTLEPDHLTSLWVPALQVSPAVVTAGDEVARLVALMDTLRARCPWDRVQTHATLMPHLVEECYEVLDALAELSPVRPGLPRQLDHLEEELGDLLFQIVFHARLASEVGAFDLAGVARRVHDKLVHRHPHVFRDAEAPDPSRVVSTWEEIKKKEKGRSSVTEGVPSALPALMLATKLARKARAVGFEASAVHGVDVSSALAALSARAARAEPRPDDPLTDGAIELEREVGELLFDVAILALRVGVDAEQALRSRALALREDIRAREGVPDED